MSNQPLQQNQGEGKFLYSGMNVHLPSDLLPKGKTPLLYNVEPDMSLGTMQARGGTSANVTGLSSPITSWKYTGSGSNGFYVGTCADGSGVIYDQNFTQIGSFGAGTFSGNPTSIVHYRPPSTPIPYAYVFDSKSTTKVAYGSPSALVSPVGIYPSNVPPTAGKLDVATHFYMPDGTATSHWSNINGGSGSAFTTSITRRDPGSITISSVINFQTFYSQWGPLCIIPTPGANLDWITPNSTLWINEAGTGGTKDYCVVDQVFGPVVGIQPDTIKYIAFDSGTTGWCTIVPAQAKASDLGVGRVFTITAPGNTSAVFSFSEAADGTVSFRAILPGGGAAGDQLNWYACFTTSNNTYNHSVGETLTAYCATSSLTYSASSGDQVTKFSLLGSGSGFSTSYLNTATATNNDDYVHWSFLVSNALAVDEIVLIFGTDTAAASPNPFTNNYWYKTFTQGSFTPNLLSNETTTQLALSAFQDTLLNQESGGLDQMGSGSGQWFEAMFKIDELTQVGTGPAASLSNIVCLGFVVFFNANVTVSWGSVWTSQIQAGGPAYVPNQTPLVVALGQVSGGGPDSNWNSYGYQGTPVKYRYRYRDALTGALSNVSPENLNAQICRRSIQILTLPSSGSTNNYIDVERFGGTSDTWRRVITVTDPGGATFWVDSISEATISSSEPLELDQYVPFPTLQQPVSGTVNVAGTSVKLASGGPFNTGWVRGTEILINSRPYTLYAQPTSSSFLQLQESVVLYDNGTGLQFSVPEPLVAGTPLPYADGPFDGRIFSCGDLNNPGYLYFTNIDNPDTAAGNGYIEVTGPNIPLTGVAVYEGALFVFTTSEIWRVEPTPNGANPYSAYKLSGSYGLASPFMFDFSGPVGYYGTHDGLVQFGLNGSKMISWADLRPLFPFDGHTGVPVVNVFGTFFPVNYARFPRVCYAEDRVYLDYYDTNGTNLTLVFNTFTEGFQFHNYNQGSSLHYLVGGVTRPRVQILGTTSPGVYYFGPLLTQDNGTDFSCAIITPSLDQGATRNPKNYYDVMVDYSYTSGSGTPTVNYYTNNYGNITSTSPFSLVAASSRTQIQQNLSVAGSPITGLNIGSMFTWSSSQILTLFEWQPSFTVVPVDYAASPYSWQDCGTTHRKWVQGLRIGINTGGSNKTFQVYYDNVAGPTFTVNSGSQTEYITGISFAAPIKAYLVKLVPLDSVLASVYSIDWIYNLEPDVATAYVTQPTCLGLEGFGHAREFELAYAATGASIFSVICDGTTYTFLSDGTGTAGVEKKIYCPLPPLKGKLWSLSYSGIGLQVYEKDCEFRVKQWASSGPYKNVNIAGDESLTQGAKI